MIDDVIELSTKSYRSGFNRDEDRGYLLALSLVMRVVCAKEREKVGSRVNSVYYNNK